MVERKSPMQKWARLGWWTKTRSPNGVMSLPSNTSLMTSLSWLTTPFVLHLLGCRVDKNKLLPHANILSFQKFLAEATPAKITTTLGWVFNTRCLLSADITVREQVQRMDRLHTRPPHQTKVQTERAGSPGGLTQPCRTHHPCRTPLPWVHPQSTRGCHIQTAGDKLHHLEHPQWSFLNQLFSLNRKK